MFHGISRVFIKMDGKWTANGRQIQAPVQTDFGNRVYTMAKRRLNLERFGISARRRNELEAFSLQYPEWQAQLCAGANKRNAGEAAFSNGVDTAEALRRKKMLVEYAVFETVGRDAALYESLLYTVTHGISHEAATMPVGRRLFFDLCAAYYVNLDRLKG